MGWNRDVWPSLQRRGSHVFVKIFLSVLLIGVSFRLFLSDSYGVLPVSKPMDDENGGRAPPGDSLSMNSSTASNAPAAGVDLVDGLTMANPQKDKCDLFSGAWIPNPAGPAYTNESCHFIESPQNCMTNGRPDTGYLYWRWKPYGCDVPPFNAKNFLYLMRNKSWALIGDSILRNHVQSLICLLSKVEGPVEVYHDKEYKSRRWHFPSHNFSLSLIWSPYLVKSETFENDDGISSSDTQLHLDILDNKWTDQFQNFNYILISGGQWFLKMAIYWENNTVIGCHNCQGRNLTDFRVDDAYRKVLLSVHHFLATSDHKPLILYRTWTPDHFENGEWFSGGTCNRTAPYKDGEFAGRDIDHLMRKVELEVFDNAAVNGSRADFQLKVLDTYGLSLMRPDGHSGPYRTFHPFEMSKTVGVQNDCLHWCLPGPIDSWNDLVMELVSH